MREIPCEILIHKIAEVEGVENRVEEEAKALVNYYNDQIMCGLNPQVARDACTSQMAKIYNHFLPPLYRGAIPGLTFTLSIES